MEISINDIIFKMLSSELNIFEPNGSDMLIYPKEVLSAVYSLSKAHDIAHIVSAALRKYGALENNELKEKFYKEELMSVYRNEQMKHVYEQVCEKLDNEDVPYIPLKGAIVRPFYPSESMRTSCDIDILVKEKDFDHATRALRELGFDCKEKGYHDISLFSPAGVHVELHFSLLEDTPNLDKVLKHAWDHTEQVSGCRYKFSTEFFLFHMFAHTSYHFLRGGCGIRSLMDVWVMKHRMGMTCDQAEEMLEAAGIYKFSVEFTRLADICFCGEPKDDCSDALLSYILNGGLYGNQLNKFAVTKAKNGNTFLYAMKRLFLPYRTMTVNYPALKKLPILLPACWVIRFFDMIFGGKTGRVITELKLVKDVSDNEMEKMRQIRCRLGI